MSGEGWLDLSLVRSCALTAKITSTAHLNFAGLFPPKISAFLSFPALQNPAMKGLPVDQISIYFPNYLSLWFPSKAKANKKQLKNKPKKNQLNITLLLHFLFSIMASNRLWVNKFLFCFRFFFFRFLSFFIMMMFFSFVLLQKIYLPPHS